MKIVALIPARAGSKRVPGKNMRVLGGYILIWWTVKAAIDSGIFDTIAVCSDADGIDWAPLSVRWIRREPVPDDQPDIVWVRQALAVLPRAECFAILRPTSPFRTAETIRRAWDQWQDAIGYCDSLRAVRPVKESPYKMWTCEGPGHLMAPILPGSHPDGTPYHSSPTQSLPPVYVQTSSLEIGWTSNVEVHGTIHGRKVRPFFTDEWEGFSIDYPEDFARAERHLAALSSPTPA